MSLQIVPWNYPISLFARSVAVSLVVGNTIVIKPPELCPISSNIFGKKTKVVLEGWAVIVTVTAQPSRTTLVQSG